MMGIQAANNPAVGGVYEAIGRPLPLSKDNIGSLARGSCPFFQQDATVSAPTGAEVVEAHEETAYGPSGAR